MAYTSGLLNHRADILKRNTITTGSRGRGSGEPTYRVAATVWASLKWQKGMKPFQLGAIEAYDVVMIRMRYNPLIDMDCRIRIDGKVYQIEQMDDEFRDNQTQIIAKKIVGETQIIEPTNAELGTGRTPLGSI